MSSQKGFTLIELMVATTVGLIVSAAAVSLIVAIDRANSETIQSTRLTQELRSLATVISDDLKRARRLDDPISMIGQGSAIAGPFDVIATPSAGCITYGYTGTTASASANDYRAIGLRAASGVGAVWLVADPAAANVTCSAAAGAASTVSRLSSTQINVTALTFTCVGGTGAGNCTDAMEVDVAISGKLLTGDNYTNSITRTFTQPVLIRAAPVKL